MKPSMNDGQAPLRERVPIRLRESRSTLSAWRISLEGGAIVLAEVDAERAFYRGEGSLLGASQEKLAEIWLAHTEPPEPGGTFPQLG